VALAVDGSTPAVAEQNNGTTRPLTTASFTPPAGSLLVVLWGANTLTAAPGAAPTITDNLGVHLTYTLQNWQSRANSPTVNGQSAAWTAVVGSSAAMTVTVTHNLTSNCHAGLQVVVITGQHATPVGVHAGSGSTSTAAIAQSYTGTANSSWGFGAAGDWSATGTETGGTGTTVISSNTLGATDVSYGTWRRTAGDGTSGGTTTLNVTLAATSTAINWSYLEVIPAAAAAAASLLLPPRGRQIGNLIQL
jgi:hypothetical protein